MKIFFKKGMKVLFFLASIVCAATASAQNDGKKNLWAIEAGIGGNKATAVNLGFRWQHNFHPYVAWDVLALNVNAPVEELSEMLMPQLMTGVRLLSPEVSGMKVYMMGRAGYGGIMSGNADARGQGMVFEIGAGINITRHLYVGYAYNHQDLGTGEVKVNKQTISFDRESKYHSFRIGWIF